MTNGLDTTWKVVFGKDFKDSIFEDGPGGEELRVGQYFEPVATRWDVYSVYRFSEGMVVDFGYSASGTEMVYYRDDIEDPELTEEQKAQLRSPLDIHVGGLAIDFGKIHGECTQLQSVIWSPYPLSEEKNPEAAELAMEHYGCDRHRGYRFFRACFPLALSEECVIDSMIFTLMPYLYPVEDDSVAAISGLTDGAVAELIVPISGQEVRICVLSAVEERQETATEEGSRTEYFVRLTYRAEGFTAVELTDAEAAETGKDAYRSADSFPCGERQICSARRGTPVAAADVKWLPRFYFMAGGESMGCRFS